MSIVGSFPHWSRPRGAGRAAVALTALSVLVVVISGEGAAHATPTPYVSTQASPSGFPVGGQIFSSAMLGYGLNPTGSLTFTLFGPDDPGCGGTPLLVTTTPVNGNGYYESSRYSTGTVGDYRWTVVYGGDSNNNPSAPTLCSDPGGVVSVAKRTPTLNASPSWTPPSATDVATLAIGAGPEGPTGTLTYQLYGPGNMVCAGSAVFTTTRTVTGNGSYTSAPYYPPAVGTYQWVVNYSGDANNVARSTSCADTSNGFTVLTVSPTAVSASPAVVVRGGRVTVTWSGVVSPTSGDWVGLYMVGAADGATVTAWNHTTGDASGSVSLRFPWRATPGLYEVRLMADNTLELLATSTPLTLVSPLGV